jgi:predicted nuclease of restriction endonuclease-like (RecB) superfamily
MQRASDAGVAFYKMTVEVSKPKEGLHLGDILGYRPFCDTTDLGRIHVDLASAYDKSKVLDQLRLKGALLRVEEELIRAQNLQDFFCDLPELLTICGKAKDIVHVDDHFASGCYDYA